MSKEHFLELHSKMEEVIIGAGIQRIKYAALIKKKYNDEQFEQIYKWFLEVHEAYLVVKRTLDQLPAEIWERYKIFQFNLPEEIILRDRQKLLRDKWYERPKFQRN